MKIILIFLFLIQCLPARSQYSIYPTSDPRSFIVNSEFISNHSISSCQIENYFESRFIGSGVTYFDSLGRQYCYDVFDSLGKINYTGHYYYDSSTLKPKKFVGILHSSVGKYEENFSPVYKAGLLQIDSSDKMGGTIYTN